MTEYSDVEKMKAFKDYMTNHEKYFASTNEMKIADINPKFKLDYWSKNQSKITKAYIEFAEGI